MFDLKTARRALWEHASQVKYENANGQDYYNFNLKLAQVLEIFFSIGTWKDGWKRATLTASFSEGIGTTITLPRGFATLESYEPVPGCPFPIYSRFHEMFSTCCVSSNGGTKPDTDCWGCGSAAKVYNDAAQTFVIPSGTFRLRFLTTNLEVEPSGEMPSLTLMGGLDQDGNEIFSVTQRDFTDDMTVSQQYTQVPFIQKTVTNEPVYVYAVDVVTADQTLIAVYAPGETTPAYRQYLVTGLKDGDTVSCICKMQMVIPVADNDIVFPNHLGALTLGLQAIQYRNVNDPTRYAEAMGPNYPLLKDRAPWGAIDLLDAELASLQVAELPGFNVSPNFGAGSIPNLI